MFPFFFFVGFLEIELHNLKFSGPSNLYFTVLIVVLRKAPCSLLEAKDWLCKGSPQNKTTL